MNKKLLTIVVLLFISISIHKSFAQCTPDLSITEPGLYPDSATGLPQGNVGSVYNAIVQVKVPVDTPYMGFTYVFDNITVNSITGLPPGLTYTCNPSNCVFPGGGNGCASIDGTPSAAGVYPITIDATANGTILGLPLPVNQTYDYYTIRINGGLGIELISNLTFDALQNNPNPFNDYSKIIFTTPVSGNFTLKVFNLIGKEVYREIVKGHTGTNIIKLDAKDFNTGVYMYSLDNGSKTLTRRMVVSGK